MTHAELLRNDADLATREGGMYYSGEYLSQIAAAAESLELENAKLRKLVVRMYKSIRWSDMTSDSMFSVAHSYEKDMRELGIEVPR